MSDSKSKFKDFISYEGIERKVYKILRNHRVCNLEEHMAGEHPEYYIDALCCWSDTIEGDRFWRALDTKWKSFLNGEIHLEPPIPKLKSIW